MKPRILILLISVLMLNSCSSTTGIQNENIFELLKVDRTEAQKTTLLIHSKTEVKNDTAFFFGHILDNFDFRPLIGATIMLTNNATGEILGTVADRMGEFLIFPSPGNYRLEIKFIGYDSLVIEDFSVNNYELHKILVGLKSNTDASEIIISTG